MIHLKKNDPRPLYEQLREALRAEIASGAVAADRPLTDERTLATKLGLSRMTVRRAIADLTDEGLLERIRGRGTFAAARGAGSAPALRELVVLAAFDRSEIRSTLFYQRILHGIESALAPDVAIVIRSSHRLAGPPVSAAARAAGGSALCVLGIVDAKILAAAAGCDVPTVLVDSAQPRGARLDQVGHEDRDSARGAVAALVDLGHRDIALVNYPSTPSADLREKGYLDALSAHGIAVDRKRMLVVSCNATAAYARTRALLAAPRPPTAIFCTTDEIALGALAAAKDHGVDVPGRLSIVGFGDLGHFCVPPLSTVRIPIEQLGATAVRLLHERLADPRLPARGVVLPTELILRGTCAVAPRSP